MHWVAYASAAKDRALKIIAWYSSMSQQKAATIAPKVPVNEIDNLFSAQDILLNNEMGVLLRPSWLSCPIFYCRYNCPYYR